MSSVESVSDIQTSGPKDVQTPVKKSKMEAENLNTAESEQLTTQKLEDTLDAYELFENFDSLIKVSEQGIDEDISTEDTHRKLEYEVISGISKLCFSPNTESMKKKAGRVLNEEFTAIQLFKVQGEEQKHQMSKDTHCEQIGKNQERSNPSTPPKKRKGSSKENESLKRVLRTPKKEKHFRDLN